MIDKIKLELANYHLEQAKPTIREHSAEYERGKFKEFLAAHPSGKFWKPLKFVANSNHIPNNNFFTLTLTQDWTRLKHGWPLTYVTPLWPPSLTATFNYWPSPHQPLRYPILTCFFFFLYCISFIVFRGMLFYLINCNNWIENTHRREAVWTWIESFIVNCVCIIFAEIIINPHSYFRR